jgi:hypothetical protein
MARANVSEVQGKRQPCIVGARALSHDESSARHPATSSGPRPDMECKLPAVPPVASHKAYIMGRYSFATDFSSNPSPPPECSATTTPEPLLARYLLTHRQTSTHHALGTLRQITRPHLQSTIGCLYA